MGKELKRMNYFDGLFLKAEDYRQDKDYIKRVQGLHNRYLHTWGIVSGLEVKPVLESSMEVVVTEGVALDLADGEIYGTDLKESTSRQIVIYEGHPDNPLDLSEYRAEENIYIYVSYYEEGADRDNEKGQGQEIHIWEKGKISHSSKKPLNPEKDIILARVVPRKVTRETINSDGSSAFYDEAVIDNTCIFDTDIDGTPLRVGAGPRAKVLALEQFKFRLGEDTKDMPWLAYIDRMEPDPAQLIFNSNWVKFKNNVIIDKDLSFAGQLIYRNKNGEIQKEFLAEEPIFQLNSRIEDSKDHGSENEWEPRDGGIEVYRGGTGSFPDARIVWSEADKVWKAGLGNDLSPIFYGPERDALINKSFADNLHKHSKLSTSKGTILSVDNSGDISAFLDMALPEKNILFQSETLGLFGERKPFANLDIDGPVLTGSVQGFLGTTGDGQKAVLLWNSTGNKARVGIGTVNPADTLEVCGSARLLGSRNPVKLTSEWTAFPDITANQAEICNDTTTHKALMIVGNQSAGQGRKVAVWDRLDVNGIMKVIGNMQLSKGLNPSTGTGDKGVVFSGDPGGGSGDSARIQYYPRSGEACTLEIGTSNDSDDNIFINSSGNAGVGTLNPKDKLDVSGWTRFNSDSNPIRFTSKWSGFPDISSKNAEISNDTNDYKTLMIVGNRSAGTGRKVSIWDKLEVNGSLVTKGSFQVRGAIVPGVGNCDVKGIMFPRDYYGGGGDAAWIRYYSDTLRGGGENMTLEIGISNDDRTETVTKSYFVSKCPYSWVTNPCGYWRTETVTTIGNKGDRMCFRASGGTYIEGNFYITSTRECKENIGQLEEDAVRSAVEQLEPVEFNFKGDSKRTTIGFIAEDTPDMLTAGDKKAISPFEILTVLVSEVKDQEKMINRLKKKVAALKA
ncbi:MAG TPA: tail fiber domain-containing protein [Ruminiclostridium sp.]|nr:tail fiber domain-containing protein [Ruminiclostridium sp.]